jgi:phosphotransferase system enzyme I (PtsI)
MIETPAAVITASHLLDAVDFVSIGTNDLAQFTMAADRMVADLATLNDPWQPAVLGLVNMTCRVAAEKGKPVGVCGEAAADPLLAIVLVGLGVTSLSMAPRALTFVAGQLSRVSFHDCLRAAEVAVAAPTAAAARRAVNELLSQTAA